MSPSGDEQVAPAGSETGNVLAGGQGNQVLSNVSAGRDVVLGDKVDGDKIGRDKVVIEHVEQLVLQNPTGAPGPGATAWIWPHPWDFSGYIHEKRKDFSGRQWLFDQVGAWYRDPHGSQALLIEADFGVGKSAFMAELSATGSSQRQLPVAAHHFCDHNTNATLEAGTFVASVAAQLSKALPDYRAAVEADPEAQRRLSEASLDPAAAFSQAVIAPLHRIEASQNTLLLLVDGLDETLASTADSETSDKGDSIVELLERCPERLPLWLRVLTTSRRRQEVRQPLEATYSCDVIDAEQNPNLEDIRLYVSDRCSVQPLAGRLAAAGKDHEAMAAQLSDYQQSGGKFLYAVRVLNALATGRLTPERLDVLPPGMDGFYYDAFKWRFHTDAAYAPMRQLLGVLALQREPLSFRALGVHPREEAERCGRPAQPHRGFSAHRHDQCRALRWGGGCSR